MYLDVRIGYSRMFQGIYDAGTKYGAIAEQLGIPNANAGGAAPGLSTITIAGMTGLGDGAGSLQKVNNNWQIAPTLSWVRGRHEWKFGYDYMSRRFAFHSPGAPSGAFTFNGNYANFGLADFLFGRPINSRYDQTGAPSIFSSTTAVTSFIGQYPGTVGNRNIVRSTISRNAGTRRPCQKAVASTPMAIKISHQ